MEDTIVIKLNKTLNLKLLIKYALECTFSNNSDDYIFGKKLIDYNYFDVTPTINFYRTVYDNNINIYDILFAYKRYITSIELFYKSLINKYLIEVLNKRNNKLKLYKLGSRLLYPLYPLTPYQPYYSNIEREFTKFIRDDRIVDMDSDCYDEYKQSFDIMSEYSELSYMIPLPFIIVDSDKYIYRLSYKSTLNNSNNCLTYILIKTVDELWYDVLSFNTGMLYNYIKTDPFYNSIKGMTIDYDNINSIFDLITELRFTYSSSDKPFIGYCSLVEFMSDKFIT